MFSKVEIKSDANRSNVCALLGTQSGKLPGWNFCKYVVGRDGKAVAFFESNVSPSDSRISAAIDKALDSPVSQHDS